MNAAAIKVIVADDHVMLRKGFISLLCDHKEVQVIGEAGNGIKLLELLALQPPDIVILDIMMPEMNGMEAAAIIATGYPSVGVILLSVSDDDRHIKQALKIGVKGYLLKSVEQEELLTAIKTVHADGRWYAKEIAERIGELVAGKSTANQVLSFTANEINILKAMCNGLNSKAIGDKLHLAKKTIDNYKEKLLYKTETKNSAELAAYAIINQLVTKEDLR